MGLRTQVLGMWLMLFFGTACWVRAEEQTGPKPAFFGQEVSTTAEEATPGSTETEESPPGLAAVCRPQPLGFNDMDREGIVSNLSLQQERMTEPSLWFVIAQQDPFQIPIWDRQPEDLDPETLETKLPENRPLVLRWFADAQTRQVDLIVNRQRWRSLDYVARYRFVNNIGTFLRPQNYFLRLFNPQADCLAIYRCEDLDRCQIEFFNTEQDGLLQFDDP
ncbi:MAG: hypothetical protein AAGG02_06445 [Cyanobacteria bacterium P01_H01_bin.15]